MIETHSQLFLPPKNHYHHHTNDNNSHSCSNSNSNSNYKHHTTSVRHNDGKDAEFDINALAMEADKTAIEGVGERTQLDADCVNAMESFEMDKSNGAGFRAGEHSFNGFGAVKQPIDDPELGGLISRLEKQSAGLRGELKIDPFSKRWDASGDRAGVGTFSGIGKEQLSRFPMEGNAIERLSELLQRVDAIARALDKLEKESAVLHRHDRLAQLEAQVFDHGLRIAKFEERWWAAQGNQKIGEDGSGGEEEFDLHPLEKAGVPFAALIRAADLLDEEEWEWLSTAECTDPELEDVESEENEKPSTPAPQTPRMGADKARVDSNYGMQDLFRDDNRLLAAYERRVAMKSPDNSLPMWSSVFQDALESMGLHGRTLQAEVDADPGIASDMPLEAQPREVATSCAEQNSSSSRHAADLRSQDGCVCESFVAEKSEGSGRMYGRQGSLADSVIELSEKSPQFWNDSSGIGLSEFDSAHRHKHQALESDARAGHLMENLQLQTRICSVEGTNHISREQESTSALVSDGINDKLHTFCKEPSSSNEQAYVGINPHTSLRVGVDGQSALDSSVVDTKVVESECPQQSSAGMRCKVYFEICEESSTSPPLTSALFCEHVHDAAIVDAGGPDSNCLKQSSPRDRGHRILPLSSIQVADTEVLATGGEAPSFVADSVSHSDFDALSDIIASSEEGDVSSSDGTLRSIDIGDVEFEEFENPLFVEQLSCEEPSSPRDGQELTAYSINKQGIEHEQEPHCCQFHNPLFVELASFESNGSYFDEEANEEESSYNGVDDEHFELETRMVSIHNVCRSRKGVGLKIESNLNDVAGLRSDSGCPGVMDEHFESSTRTMAIHKMFSNRNNTELETGCNSDDEMRFRGGGHCTSVDAYFLQTQRNIALLEADSSES